MERRGRVGNQIDVQVSFVAAAQPSLTIATPNVTIQDGDWVSWTFQNLPSGLLPGILFADGQPLGPFAALRIEPPTSVWAKGNVGTPGLVGALFAYLAVAVDQDGVEQAQGIGTLTNMASAADSSPVVSVTYQAGPTPPQGTITIDPLVLNLNRGDSAAWVFVNPPVNSRPVLVHQMSSGPSALGPFASQTLAPFGSGFILVAAGYTPPVAVGAAMPYSIELRSDIGSWGVNNDPSIENLGPPPGGEDGQ